jgi:hypothetical protein
LWIEDPILIFIQKFTIATVINPNQ